MGAFAERFKAFDKQWDPKVSITVFGEAELIRALNKLEDKVRKKITRKVLYKASTPILQAARKNLRGHTVTGNLRKSLGRRSKTYPSGVSVVVIGPRIRRASGKQKALKGQHGYIVEFGTGPRFRKRMGGMFARRVQGSMAEVEDIWQKYFSGEGRYPTGTMPAIPFLRPAYMSKRTTARHMIFKQLRAELYKEAARNANR